MANMTKWRNDEMAKRRHDNMTERQNNKGLAGTDRIEIEEECFAPPSRPRPAGATFQSPGVSMGRSPLLRIGILGINGGTKSQKIIIFHPKIAKISPAAEVFQVPLAKVRVEIERRIKMMTPGL